MPEVRDAAVVDGALEKLSEMLASDGYNLRWEASSEDKVVVTVEAGSEACADCLVPEPVMKAIMSEALETTPYSLDHVVLPESPEAS